MERDTFVLMRIDVPAFTEMDLLVVIIIHMNQEFLVIRLVVVAFLQLILNVKNLKKNF
jgi:hypothetical protein